MSHSDHGHDAAIAAEAFSTIDVWVMMGFGIIGFFMNRHGFSAAPLVMGLILGAMVEETFSQSMIIYDNNFMMMFESKIVILFFALTVVSLTSPFWSLLRGKK